MNLLINTLKTIAIAIVIINIVACTPSVDLTPIPLPEQTQSQEPGYEMIINQKDSSYIEFNSSIIDLNQSSWKLNYYTSSTERKEVEFGGWSISGDGCDSASLQAQMVWRGYENDVVVEEVTLSSQSQTLIMEAGRLYRAHIEVTANTTCDFGLLSFAVYE